MTACRHPHANLVLEARVGYRPRTQRCPCGATRLYENGQPLTAWKRKDALPAHTMTPNAYPTPTARQSSADPRLGAPGPDVATASTSSLLVRPSASRESQDA